MVYNNKKHRERGGIGRHNRLKICRLRGVRVRLPPLVPREVKMSEYCNNKFFIQGILKEYVKKVPQANLMSETCQRDLATFISEKIQEQKDKI